MYNSFQEEEEWIILAHFHDGYSLRNVFQFLRNTCRCVHLVFDPEGITIEEENAQGSILVRCRIRADDLTNYQYNQDPEKVPSFFCAFNAAEMQKATKAVAKKDGLKLYVKGGSNPNIYIEVLNVGSGSNGDGLKMIPLIENNKGGFYDIKYERKRANAKPPINQFSKFCADIASLKCTKVHFIAFEHGVLIQGLETNEIKTIKRFGDVNIPSLPSSSRNFRNGTGISGNKPRLNIHYPDEVGRITIAASAIRLMSKFNNLCPTGIIKIFIEKENPLKIISNIGCYGTLTLYIKHFKEDD